MKRILTWILAGLKEKKTTLPGLVVFIAGLIGVTLSPNQTESIALLIQMAMGVLLLFVRSK